MPIFAPVNRSSGRHMGRGREERGSRPCLYQADASMSAQLSCICIVLYLVYYWMLERTTIRCRSTGSSCLDFSLQCRIVSSIA